MQPTEQTGRKTIILSLCLVLAAFFFVWNFYLHEYLSCAKTIPQMNLLINLVVVFAIAFLLHYSHPPIRPVSTTIILAASCLIFVLLFHYWHCNRPWETIDYQISFIEIVLAVVSLLIVLWGGYTAVKQLQIAAAASRETAQSNKLSAFQCMIGILQKESARERRKHIFQLFDDQTRRLREPDVEKWSDETLKDVHDALVDIDQIGLMVKYGLLDYEFLEGWDYSLYKILHIAEGLQAKEEKKYVYTVRTPSGMESHSNYYLGIAELRRRKKFDYEFELPIDNTTPEK